MCACVRKTDREHSAQDLWTVPLHYFWERSPLGSPFATSYYILLDVAQEGLAYLYEHCHLDFLRNILM